MEFRHSNVHLPVRDLKETLDYYREQLGFYDEWTFGEKDGGIRRDQVSLLFGEDPDFILRINQSGSRLPLLWFVKDIDAVYAEWKQRGIPFASELMLHPYGFREFAFVDINGYYIRIAEEKEIKG